MLTNDFISVKMVSFQKRELRVLPQTEAA